MLLVACGGGSGGSSGVNNVAPVANAGPVQSVLVGDLVTLDGSASADSDGSLLNFTWTLTARPAGSSATLAGASSVAPTFTADVAGSYVASLVVDDGLLGSTAATVTITASVANAAPVANAGPAQSVQTGTLVTLNGAASSDANGDPLSYAWTLTAKPAGSTAVLAGATSAAPTFITDLAGIYVASLVVNDGHVTSQTATVSIAAGTSNVAPVAAAGAAQSVVVGTVVKLDGGASSDGNGDALSYAWSLTAKPAGSAAVLAAAATVTPTFTTDFTGVYVASLIVNDGQLSSAPSTVSIAASVGNAAPVANAGVAQSVATGSVVTFDGHASSDANGDTLSYLWTLASSPGGSTATLVSATSPTPTLTVDLAGTYVASLVVNDGKVDSGPSTVTITARTGQSGLPVEELMATAAFGDVEFDWARDGVYCGTCNFGAGNARFNWVDHNNRLWVANIDPDSGAVVQQDGHGVLVDNQAAYYSDYGNGPEWVFSALGSQLVYTRYLAGETVADNNPRVGLAQQIDNSHWSATTLETGAPRNLPAPTQTVTDSVPRIVYGDPGAQAMYWRLLSEPPSTEAKTKANSIGLSLRWIPATGQFVYADGVRDPVDGKDYQQIKFYDTDTAADPVQLTSNDQKQKRGAFMLSAPEFGGEQVFFTVADRTQLQVYRNLPDSGGVMKWTVVNTIVSPDPLMPYIATPEPFFYNGHWWIFMILSSSKSASDVTIPTVLALTGIDPAVPSVRMLQDEGSPVRLRQDPEYFITSQGAYIYYSRSIPGNDNSGPVHDGYYRVNTGLGAPKH
jgi:hypothetical protein